MSIKTNKSYSKRLKLTKSGKLLGRTPGFNHNNAKQSRRKQLNGKRMQDFSMGAKERSRMIANMK